uniref:SAC3 family protein 1 n=1 Tax=Rhizophora mucronata TaxID=61149 RepID=A0A2P2LFK3_RHIMU
MISSMYKLIAKLPLSVCHHLIDGNAIKYFLASAFKLSLPQEKINFLTAIESQLLVCRHCSCLQCKDLLTMNFS